MSEPGPSLFARPWLRLAVVVAAAVLAAAVVWGVSSGGEDAAPDLPPNESASPSTPAAGGGAGPEAKNPIVGSGDPSTTSAQAQANARTVAAAIERCRPKTQDYARCTTRGALNIDLPIVTGVPAAGEVAISAVASGYLVSAGASDGTIWRYAQTAGESPKTSCLQSDGATPC